jgi:hypothetical protein
LYRTVATAIVATVLQYTAEYYVRTRVRNCVIVVDNSCNSTSSELVAVLQRTYCCTPLSTTRGRTATCQQEEGGAKRRLRGANAAAAVQHSEWGKIRAMVGQLLLLLLLYAYTILSGAKKGL